MIKKKKVSFILIALFVLMVPSSLIYAEGGGGGGGGGGFSGSGSGNDPSFSGANNDADVGGSPYVIGNTLGDVPTADLPIPQPQPSCSLTAVDNPLMVGNSTYLVLNSSDRVTYASILGIGQVGVNSNTLVSPTVSITYNASVSDGAISANCYETINITSNPIDTISNVAISCTPNIISVGQSATVTWACNNGYSNTSASGTTNGSYVVSPTNTSRYDVSCGKNINGVEVTQRASCVVSVQDTLNQVPVGGYTTVGGFTPLFGGANSGIQNSIPSASITAPTLVIRGQTVNVFWSSENVNSCSVIGPDLISNKLSGSENIQITHESLYTIECDGGIKDTALVRILPAWNEQ